MSEPEIKRQIERADGKIADARLAEIAADRSRLVTGDALQERLDEMSA
jgi:hypothetical protein